MLRRIHPVGVPASPFFGTGHRPLPASFALMAGAARPKISRALRSLTPPCFQGCTHLPRNVGLRPVPPLQESNRPTLCLLFCCIQTLILLAFECRRVNIYLPCYIMSTKKIAVSERVRNFRTKAKLSQAELGERLSVSGNYIYLIESGRKPPSATLVKLFEHLERAPQYDTPSSSGVSASRGSSPGGGATVPPNAIYSILSLETLLTGFSEVSEKLASVPAAGRKPVIGQLRDMLDEIESRVLASSGPLTEAQAIAVKAASARGGKRGA